MARTLFPLMLALPLAASSLAFAQQEGAKKAATKQTPMSFFITSVGSGKGGDLGGIKGADAHCQALAKAAGAGNRTWHAYLSTQGAGAVNARDRIGKGPWRNSKGAVIANNVDELHGAKANLSKQTILTEKGQPVNGRGDNPNQHDMLTGSQMNGNAYTDNMDHTCSNYTSNVDGKGNVQVGHHDKIGNTNGSWNSSHPSRGCSQASLPPSGGAGYLYCFAPGN